MTEIVAAVKILLYSCWPLSDCLIKRSCNSTLGPSEVQLNERNEKKYEWSFSVPKDSNSSDEVWSFVQDMYKITATAIYL